MSGTLTLVPSTCPCGRSLETPGAVQCPQCRAAHARAHIGQRTALLKKLPRIAPPRHEAAWVACNLGARRMSLESAPSLRAVRLLQALKKDDALKQAFWLAQLAPQTKKRPKREREW